MLLDAELTKERGENDPEEAEIGPVDTPFPEVDNSVDGVDPDLGRQLEAV